MKKMKRCVIVDGADINKLNDERFEMMSQNYEAEQK